MNRRKKYILFIQILALGALFLAPSVASACNVRPYAKSYINKINAVFGGEKPALIVEDGIDEERAAFYDGSIHIFAGDYEGKCSEKTAYLKSVISHEYSHYIASKLKKVSSLKGERLAYVAEHAIGDAIFGDDIEYDNDKDLEHPKSYDAIKKMIVEKKNKKIVAKTTKKVYSKNKIIGKK